MNALMMLWRKVIQRSRYRIDPNARAYSTLPHDVRQLMMSGLYLYGVFDYAIAQRILDKNSIHPMFRYRRFSVPKKDGTPRHLVEPDANLKQVQKLILKKILNPQAPHWTAVGYRRKKSTANHVWAHAGADIIITADIEDFFPNTKTWRVSRWWNNPTDGPYGQILTLLTTYQGGLPQGAPTSPALSNLVNYQMDEALHRRAEATGGIYTRYCDDLVFSWRDGNQPPSDFENGVRATLSEYEYRLNATKGWRVYERGDEPEITGAVLTKQGKIALPEHIRQTMRQLARSRDPYDATRLDGYRAYESMLKNKPKLAGLLSRGAQAQQVRTYQPAVSYDDDDDYDDDDEYEDEDDF
jgi:RNA-directed DNA polymerase